MKKEKLDTIKVYTQLDRYPEDIDTILYKLVRLEIKTIVVQVNDFSITIKDKEDNFIFESYLIQSETTFKTTIKVKHFINFFRFLKQLSKQYKASIHRLFRIVFYKSETTLYSSYSKFDAAFGIPFKKLQKEDINSKITT